MARAERELLAASWTREPVAHIVSGASGSGSVPAAAIEVISQDFGPSTEAQMGGTHSHMYMHDHVAQWYRDDPVYGRSLLEDTQKLIKEQTGGILSFKDWEVTYDCYMKEILRVRKAREGVCAPSDVDCRLRRRSNIKN